MDAIRMNQAAYGLYRRSDQDFDKVLGRVREALQKEGFGIITEIDMKATLMKKLGVAFPRYVVLGACDPKMANEALRVEADVGLLLPCNVVVSDTGQGTEVSAVKPSALFTQLVKKPGIEKLSQDIETRLTRALDQSVK